MKEFTCPKCGHQFTSKDVARALASIRTPLRAAASRANGRKGGRPPSRRIKFLSA